MLSFRAISLAAALVLGAASVAQAAGIHDLAPADEYFGRMRMSVLGIRNALDTLERRAAGHDARIASLTGQLALIDDALNDWRAHYPRDTWLPRFQAKRTRVVSLIALNGARAHLRF